MSLPRVSVLGYRRVTFLALVALVVIVVTGGAVRLTGSGLGCPDWPTCGNGRVVAEWQFHPMVEFTNRVFTGVVAVAVILGVLGSLLREPRRRDLTWLSLSLVLGVFAQAVLGGISVQHKLDPKFVMAHFLLSQAIVFAAVVLHHRAKQPEGKPHPIVHRDYVWLARAVMVVAAVVLFIGTLVTGAGPHAGAADVHRLGFQLKDITKVHSGAVWLLVFLTGLTIWRLRAAHASESIIRKGEMLMLALILQGALGYLQYALGVPAFLVVLHVAGATAVWIAVIQFNMSLYERWDVIDLPAFDGRPGVPDPVLKIDI